MKKVFSLLIALVVCFVAVGCTGGDDDSKTTAAPATTTTAAARTFTLTYEIDDDAEEVELKYGEAFNVKDGIALYKTFTGETDGIGAGNLIAVTGAAAESTTATCAIDSSFNLDTTSPGVCTLTYTATEGSVSATAVTRTIRIAEPVRLPNYNYFTDLSAPAADANGGTEAAELAGNIDVWHDADFSSVIAVNEGDITFTVTNSAVTDAWKNQIMIATDKLPAESDYAISFSIKSSLAGDAVIQIKDCDPANVGVASATRALLTPEATKTFVADVAQEVEAEFEVRKGSPVSLTVQAGKLPTGAVVTISDLKLVRVNQMEITGADLVTALGGTEKSTNTPGIVCCWDASGWTEARTSALTYTEATDTFAMTYSSVNVENAAWGNQIMVSTGALTNDQALEVVFEITSSVSKTVQICGTDYELVANEKKLINFTTVAALANYTNQDVYPHPAYQLFTFNVQVGLGTFADATISISNLGVYTAVAAPAEA